MAADVRGGGLVAGVDGLGASSAWAGAEWLGRDDRLSLVIAQPERGFGSVAMRLGGAAPEALRLTPGGREIAGELGWTRPFGQGLLSLNGFARREPGHIAGAAPDIGAAVRFRLRY